MRGGEKQGSSVFPYKTSLCLLLFASVVLRVILVLRGGHHFWPDESRYDIALGAWNLWEAGQWKAAALQILSGGDHLGFKTIMIGPAWLHKHWPAQLWIPSIIISLFSVANIYWVWRLARRLGAGPREAFWAATAMAASASMAYWARHLMPYDVAMFWALASLYTGLGPRPRAVHSVLAGVFGFVAFVTYLGYWSTVACALSIHVLRAWPHAKAMAKRAGLSFLGLAGCFGLLVLGIHLLGGDLLASLRSFSSAVTQGDFNEGHLVFFSYLWSAERISALLWAAALLAFILLAMRADKGARRRGLVWTASIVALFVILVVGSNVLHKFVVYGRLARQVVPFCALLVGWIAARVFRERASSWGERLALLALLASGASSMVQPLKQDFPAPFRTHAHKVMADYRRTHAADEARTPSQFRVLYDYFIWPNPNEAPFSARSEVLLNHPHPFTWPPYLFEGFNHEQRKKIEQTDIGMKLVLLRD
jgi:hypothetical protein